MKEEVYKPRRRSEVPKVSGDLLDFDKVLSWYDVVTQYNGRLLTKPEDKLAAVSAIARVYANSKQSPYLAGIWEPDLPLGLLWTGESAGPPDRRRAPSWSWASMDSAKYDAANLEVQGVSLVRHVVGSTTLAGPDAFGPIVDASLQFRGYILTARFKPGIRNVELVNCVGETYRLHGLPFMDGGAKLPADKIGFIPLFLGGSEPLRRQLSGSPRPSGGGNRQLEYV